MKRVLAALFFALLLVLAGTVEITPAQESDPADLVLFNGKILTVDKHFSITQALAVRGDRILQVGTDREILKLKGSQTTLIDLKGKCVLPGLYDSHTHPTGASTSELGETLPYLQTLDDAFKYIREKTKVLPEGEWIVLRFAFPTRLKDARFPTREELDKAAPNHPVLYHAGPAGIVNSKALAISKITKDTPNPANGIVVKDPVTGEPTGMLRNAYGVLRSVPGAKTTNADRKAALKKLFHLYNERGITSIADRNGDRSGFDLYHELLKTNDLTVRVNVSRGMSPYGTREEIAKRLDDLPGKDGKAGPTGKGGIWIRIGPIKFFLDGGMLNGTAYMRQPWPKGDTYQIVESDYRGLLFVPPDQARILVEEAAKRKWAITAHCAGEGAMDVLLDAYEYVDRQVPIKDLRFCITHANFPSAQNLKRCRALGVCADVQPAWLYKDGDTLHRVLGNERVRWFQPYKSWLEHTVVGGGSDHMIKLDPLRSTNPWDPWLGLEVAVTRKTESGQVLHAEECLSREDALRMYTIHNAYLHHEEREKGSLEPGRLADLIVIDRDYLTCPPNQISQVQVLSTYVGGKKVFAREESK